METFVDVKTGQPLNRIEVQEGTTRIVGLKKFALGTPPSVIVQCSDGNTAISHDVSHLGDTTKHKYSADENINMASFANEIVHLERSGLFFFQILGMQVGTTELTAGFPGGGTTPYATPIQIVVTPNRKTLFLGRPFNDLWMNHPMALGHRHPCNKMPWAPKGQCMVRFCIALEKSKVDLTPMLSFAAKRRCDGGWKDPAHRFHFVNPYDFANWQGPNTRYEWTASKDVPEPMPGMAAFWFMVRKKGVVLFWNYFDSEGTKDMAGGHIDLWNEVRMGNSFEEEKPVEGRPATAFLRARQIMFWPLA